MTRELADVLRKHGFDLYPRSLRTIGGGIRLFVAVHAGRKAVGTLQTRKTLELSSPVLPNELEMLSGATVSLHTLTWENYEKLRTVTCISPTRRDKRASFGTGDRLGLVSAAHLDALGSYPVFPVIAQQSPRELGRTGRDFKNVLLDAVMGVLESGYTGTYGADADHIKDEQHLKAAAEAGYSMYTLDISDWTQDASSAARRLSSLSRSIISDCAEMKLSTRSENYAISEQELLTSARMYEKALERVGDFNSLLQRAVGDFDLEISIDEGDRQTSVEDHLFVAEYLHRSGIDFTSLAPKFPGQFQKGVDYVGDVEALARCLWTHAALCKEIGGYRLSLHSGSDKFSIYPIFAEITEGRFHVKTSGTSWLQAVKVIASVNVPLFRELYTLCLQNLDESKKAYDVSITKQDFPAELPKVDLPVFLTRPDMRQLFHISYGVLLDNKRHQIFETLHRRESEHYSLVRDHIGKHLSLLFEVEA